MAIPAIAGALISTGLSAESNKAPNQTRQQAIGRTILPGTALGEKVLGPLAGNPVAFALNAGNNLGNKEEEERMRLMEKMAMEKMEIENRLNRQSAYANDEKLNWARGVRNSFMRG
jgi:hypothetical protein